MVKWRLVNFGAAWRAHRRDMPCQAVICVQRSCQSYGDPLRSHTLHFTASNRCGIVELSHCSWRRCSQAAHATSHVARTSVRGSRCLFKKEGGGLGSKEVWGWMWLKLGSGGVDMAQTVGSGCGGRWHERDRSHIDFGADWEARVVPDRRRHNSHHACMVHV
jgi:hypothetical protein